MPEPTAAAKRAAEAIWAMLEQIQTFPVRPTNVKYEWEYEHNGLRYCSLHQAILSRHPEVNIAAIIDAEIAPLVDLLEEAYRLLKHKGLLTSGHQHRLDAALARAKGEA